MNLLWSIVLKISYKKLKFKALTLALLLTTVSSVLAGKNKQFTTDFEQSQGISQKRKFEQNSERKGDGEAASYSFSQGNKRKRSKSSTEDKISLTVSKSEEGKETKAPLSPITSSTREAKGKEKEVSQREEEEEPISNEPSSPKEKKAEAVFPPIKEKKLSSIIENLEVIEAERNSFLSSIAQEDYTEEEKEGESKSKGEEKGLIPSIAGLTAADVRKFRPIDLLFFELPEGSLFMQVSSILNLLEGVSASVNTSAQQSVVLRNNEGKIELDSFEALKEIWNKNALSYHPFPCNNPNIFNKLFTLLVPGGKISPNSVIVGGLDSDSKKSSKIEDALITDSAQDLVRAESLRARHRNKRTSPVGETVPAPVYGAPAPGFPLAPSAVSSHTRQRVGAGNHHRHCRDHRADLPPGVFVHAAPPVFTEHIDQGSEAGNRRHVRIRTTTVTLHIIHPHPPAPTPTPAAPASVAPSPDASTGDADAPTDE